MPEPKVEHVHLRPFYPANLEPLAAERASLKGRRRDLSREQIAAQKRSAAYAKIRVPVNNTGTRMIGTGMAVLGAVGLGALIGGPATRAWFFGLQDSAGTTMLIPGALGRTAIAAVQGAFCAAWVVAIQAKAREQRDNLDRKRYQEWTRSVTVKDADLLPALLPAYAEPNPYNPADDEFQFAIGEHHGTEGHKFSNEAFFYGIPFEGLVTGGTVAFGISGSGKTAAVIKPFMRQVFGWKATTDYDSTGRGMEKCAGLVLDPKGSLAGDLRDVLRWAGIDPVLEKGRTEDRNKRHLSSHLSGDSMTGVVCGGVEEAKSAVTCCVPATQAKAPDFGCGSTNRTGLDSSMASTLRDPASRRRGYPNSVLSFQGCLAQKKPRHNLAENPGSISWVFAERSRPRRKS